MTAPPKESSMPESEPQNVVHDILRAFEQRVTETIQPKDATRAADLRILVMGGGRYTETAAKAMIKEAFDAKKIVRVGLGSVSSYRTIERQVEVDQEARERSVAQIALGTRASCLGLPVKYKMNYNHLAYRSPGALRDELAAGHLVEAAELGGTLADLVLYLEQDFPHKN
jgi:hypothetical protein